LEFGGYCEGMVVVEMEREMIMEVGGGGGSERKRRVKRVKSAS
jgi:hypothetical protein